MNPSTPKGKAYFSILIKMLRRKRFMLVISFVLLVVMIAMLAIFYEDLEQRPAPAPRTWEQIEESDTLRVVTIQSSFSAFQYKGQWYGHEYNNAKAVARALGLELQILLVENEHELVDSLFTGAADVSIWPMSYSLVNEHWFLRPTGSRWEDDERIISLKRLDQEAYRDQTLDEDSVVNGLPKYRLSMLLGSRQWQVFNHDSVRANFDFRPFIADTIPSDSLDIEQLADSMIMGKTDAVMIRSNVARLMRDYYPQLQVSDPLPFSQDSLAWMVTAGSDLLRHKIDSVAQLVVDPGKPQYTVAMKRYGELTRARQRRAAKFHMKNGQLSPYDRIFRQKGEQYDIDWRLLAGIAYIESNFRHEIVSDKGPIGLMQLMPSTVRLYGYAEEDALDPEINVDIAAQLLSRLFVMIRNRVPGVSDEDLIQFSLAAYNAGTGHVYDAIRLADTLGYNSNIWPNNVEHCLRLKSNPRYYKMSVVKQGRFNGAFTINYVHEVTDAYHTFCMHIAQ